MLIKPYKTKIRNQDYYKTTKDRYAKAIHINQLPFWTEREKVYIDNVEEFLQLKGGDYDTLFFNIVSGVSEMGVHLKSVNHKGRANKRWRTKDGIGESKILKIISSGTYYLGILSWSDFYVAICEMYGPKKERNITGENTKEKREILAKEKLLAKVQIAIRKINEFEMEDEDPMVDLIMQKICVEFVGESDMEKNYMDYLFPHIRLFGTEYSIRPPGNNS